MFAVFTRLKICTSIPLNEYINSQAEQEKIFSACITMMMSAVLIYFDSRFFTSHIRHRYQL